MTGLLFAHPEWLLEGVAWVVALATALGWAITRSRRFVRQLLGPAAFSASGSPERALVFFLSHDSPSEASSRPRFCVES